MLLQATIRNGSTRVSELLRATLHEKEIRRVIGVDGEGDLVVDGVGTLDANEDRCLYFVKDELPVDSRKALAARKSCIIIVQTGSNLVDSLRGCRVLEVAQPR